MTMAHALMVNASISQSDRALPSTSDRKTRAIKVQALRRQAVNVTAVAGVPLSRCSIEHKRRRDDTFGATLNTAPGAITKADHLGPARAQLEREFGLDFLNGVTSIRRCMERDWSRDARQLHLPPLPRVRKRGAQKYRGVRGRTAASKRTATYTSDFSDETIKSGAILDDFETERASNATSTSRRSSGRAKSAMDMLTQSMGNVRVLTRAEEKLLFTIIRRCQGLNLPQTGPVSTAELSAAASQHNIPFCELEEIQKQAARAHELIIHFNARLVLSTAARYQGRGVHIEDLVPEGMLGVKSALLRFDVTRGFKFSSLAVWHIRQKLGTFINKHGRVIRVPVHIVDLLPKVLAVRTDLASGAIETDVSHADIAEVMGISEAKVTFCLQATCVPLNLDAMSGAADDRETLLDSVVDDSMAVEDDRNERNRVVQESLSAVMQTLQPREQNILRLRFGLNAESKRVSRMEIALVYGVSHERIRQIEEEALLKLRSPWRQDFVREAADAVDLL